VTWDVHAFRAPPGTVAITLDVRGTPPSTIVFAAAELVDATAKAARLGLNYYRAVPFIARQFQRARRRGNGATVRSAALLALWSALHHPTVGVQMRAVVSDALRRDGRAHLTWNFSRRHGLAIGVGQTFVDLDAIAAPALPS
jgi:hypothetical protein